MIAERTYEHLNNPDIDISARNKLHSQSMKLLRLISEQFMIDDFSLDDVKQTFNAPAFFDSSFTGRLSRFGESHLNYLVSVRALDYNPKNKEYSVNPNSIYVGSVLN